MGNNRAPAPLEPAPAEAARGKSQGRLTKGLRPSDSNHSRSRFAKEADPARRRIPPHLEADVSQSDRDALTGLPFS